MTNYCTFPQNEGYCIFNGDPVKCVNPCEIWAILRRHNGPKCAMANLSCLSVTLEDCGQGSIGNDNIVLNGEPAPRQDGAMLCGPLLGSILPARPIIAVPTKIVCEWWPWPHTCLSVIDAIVLDYT